MLLLQCIHDDWLMNGIVVANVAAASCRWHSVEPVKWVMVWTSRWTGHVADNTSVSSPAVVSTASLSSSSASSRTYIVYSSFFFKAHECTAEVSVCVCVCWWQVCWDEEADWGVNTPVQWASSQGVVRVHWCSDWCCQYSVNTTRWLAACHAAKTTDQVWLWSSRLSSLQDVACTQRHSVCRCYAVCVVSFASSCSTFTDVDDVVFIVFSCRQQISDILFSSYLTIFIVSFDHFIWFLLYPLSVRASATSQCSVKIAKTIITQRMLHDSLGTPLFWCQKPLWNSDRSEVPETLEVG